MSDGKQTKKCRQSFNVYIPPPARKSENNSQQVNSKEVLKSKKVVKVRNGEKDIVNKRISCTKVEVSGSYNCTSSTNNASEKLNETDQRGSSSGKELCVTLNLGQLSFGCDKDKNLKEKLKNDEESDCTLFRVKASKDSNCPCSSKDNPSTSGNTKDTCLSNSTLKADLDKPFSKTDEHYSLSVREHTNDTPNTEDENQIFKNFWVKLCDQENSEPKKNKTNNLLRANEVYGSREINENCILEIYDFPAEFKTSDLREIFSSFITRGMKIRWVDDTHALGIYPSEIIAYEVLNTDLPNLKTRNLNEGIPQSRDKAKLLLPPPPPPRPKTCSASARRLVSGALGIKAVFTQAEIEEERQLLQVAREQKLLSKAKRAERLLTI